jgi:spore germination cell wall hydrolase CwlJ-like protein
MLKRSMLGLPMLLMGASCVPPAVALQSAGTTNAEGAPAAPGEVTVLLDKTKPLPAIDPIALAPGPAAKPFAPAASTGFDQSRSLDCLTTAIYHEARSESEAGQRAVAQVVLNRARHANFPNSVCGVVYQGSQRRTGCQFSFTCDGSLARRIEPGAWARARSYAEDALSGYVFEPVGLATHYHTTAIRPWWAPSLKRAITVGSHIFYRWRGEWGEPLSYQRSYAGEPAPAVPALAASDEAPVPPIAPAQVVTLDEGQVRVHRNDRATLTAGVRVHRAPAPQQLAANVPAEISAPVPQPASEAPVTVEGVNVHVR